MAWKVPRLEPSKLDDVESYALVLNNVVVSYDMISRGSELFLIGAAMAKGKTVEQAQVSIRKA